MISVYFLYFLLLGEPHHFRAGHPAPTALPLSPGEMFDYLSNLLGLPRCLCLISKVLGMIYIKENNNGEVNDSKLT